MSDTRLIYQPVGNKPMHVAVFASGGGNNLLTAIRTANKSKGEMKISLVVTDRLGIKAIDIAKEHSIPLIIKDFEAACGVWNECKHDPQKVRAYEKAAEKFHDNLLEEICAHQKKYSEPIDLVVLSYHRLIRGTLLAFFKDKIINQHPADLTIKTNGAKSNRKYVGLSPVYDALIDGQVRTRTTNFLVGDGMDDGEILCSGPWTLYQGNQPVTRLSAAEHENQQKIVSDRPCLAQVLIGIAEGRYGIHHTLTHPDNRRVITFDGDDLPYEGYDLSVYTPISFSL